MSPTRVFVALLCALPALLAGQSTPTSQCDPPEPLFTALRDAYYVPEQVNGKPRTADELLQDRKSRIMPLLEKNPGNFWVLRTYIDCMKGGPVSPDSLIAEFRSRYEARPGDPEAAFHYAYVLMGKDTRKSIELFNQILERTGDFPKIWYSLTQIYWSPAFRDVSKHDMYARRYIDRCPESKGGAALALRLQTTDGLEPFVKGLRERLTGKPEPEIAELYSILWKLEFKITPLSEHARVRQQVAEDLKFLAGLDPDKYRLLNYILKEGYKLTGNKEAEDKLTAESKQPGDQVSGYFRAQEEWSKANPTPSPAGGEEKRKAWNEKRLQLLDEWVAKLPDEDFLRVQRLQILDSLSASDAVILEEGEKVLAAARKSVGTVRSSSTSPMQVASIWAKRGLQLDRIPALVDEGFGMAAKQKQPSGPSAQSDMWTRPDRREMDEEQLFYTNTSAWQTLLTAYMKGGKYAQVRSVLAKWDTALIERRKRAEEYRNAAAAPAGQARDPMRSMRDMLVRNLPYQEAQYREALAKLAAAEGRKLDALTFYESALRARAGVGSADPSKSPAAVSASSLWKELGGTQEGWQAWLDGLKAAPASATGAKAPALSRWSAMSRLVPEFSLKDQSGRTWAATALRGKATLINVWATWCGPCREELPYLQKLYDRVKDREDIQVITLNVDDNIGLVEPFLKEQKFTFPVLLAKSFVDLFAGPLGIPTNWISDRTGNVTFEAVGFGGDGEEWIKQTVAQMDTVRGQPAP